MNYQAPTQLQAAILDWAASRHLGLAHLVSMGNKGDLNETDFLQAFAHDPNTKVIAAYLGEEESDADDKEHRDLV